jgi:hypothetical protein
MLPVVVDFQPELERLLTRKKCCLSAAMPDHVRVLWPLAMGPAARNVPGANPLSSRLRSSHCTSVGNQEAAQRN